MFSFEINGEAEILIQTANYSHYYSGVTYPPAIGSSEAINRLITIRILFYGLLVFTSLALGLFAAVIWWGTKRNRASSENFWLGILGLSFSLRVCYPFIHMLGISGGNAAYILENTTYCFFDLPENRLLTGTHSQRHYRWICFGRIGIFFMDGQIPSGICTGIWADTVLV